MNQKASGLAGPHASGACEEESILVDKTHPSPKPRRESHTTMTHTLPSSSPQGMHLPRPTSHPRPNPVCHTSITSSGNSATKSKSHDYSSKPSSRRTSCTIVDPSRPARHYRVKSAHSISVAASQDIDDVLALHFRSYSLFTNPSYHTHSELPSPTLSQTPTYTCPMDSDQVRHSMQDSPPSEDDDEPTTPDEPANVTMHWTSPCSRKREYERIDKANSGIRGLFRKVIPRSLSGPQEKFYEKDEPDDRSVRRYRLASINGSTVDEKMAIQSQAPHLARPVASQRKTSWSCF